MLHELSFLLPKLQDLLFGQGMCVRFLLYKAKVGVSNSIFNNWNLCIIFLKMVNKIFERSYILLLHGDWTNFMVIKSDGNFSRGDKNGDKEEHTDDQLENNDDNEQFR